MACAALWPGGPAVLRILPTLLEIADRRRDPGVAEVPRVIVAPEVAGEIRQPVQRGMELEIRRIGLQPPDSARETGGEVLLADEREERALRIGVRDDQA